MYIRGLLFYALAFSQLIFACQQTTSPLDANRESTSRDAAISIDALNDSRVDTEPAFGLTQRPVNTSCLVNVIPSQMPATLSATGCFSNLDQPNPTPAVGLIPFDVNSPLWSDGLAKRRFLLVPPNTQITFKELGAWELPDGTIMIKEFRLEKTKGDPSSERPIETRFMFFYQGTWKGFSYKWNSNQTDADLLAAADTQNYNVQNGNSTTTFTHEFPSRSQCNQCHIPSVGGTLGLQTGQMNRDFNYQGTTDNQLRTLAHIGIFKDPLPKAPAQLNKFPNPKDTTQPTEQRIRSYWQANCAHCHQQGTSVQANIDLRWDLTLAQTKVCEDPTQGGLGLVNPKIIKPTDADNSVLWVRMSHRNASDNDSGIQMPKLATRLPDSDMVTLIKNWINNSLTTCGN